MGQGRFRTCFLLIAVVTATFGIAGRSHAAPQFDFTAGVLTVTDDGVPPGIGEFGGLDLHRDASGNILVNGSDSGADVTDTTTINLDVTNTQLKRANITIDNLGGFAPGLGVEGTGVSEIEIHVIGADDLGFSGSDDGDSFVMGDGGVNLNGDDDVDVTFDTLPSTIDASMGGGRDKISVNGDAVTGDPVTAPVIFGGGPGGDKLVGGKGDDTFLGEAGADTIIGKGGKDDARGGPGKDRCRTEIRRGC